MAVLTENITALDAGIVVFLMLVGLGGVRQGLVRGTVRLLAVLAIGLLCSLLLFQLSPGGTLRSSLVQAGVVLVITALTVGATAWLANRLVPYHVHVARWNQAFGIIPALIQGLVIAVVLLGLAHRLAITPEQQQYIAQGLVSGPLSRPLSWLERALGSI